MPPDGDHTFNAVVQSYNSTKTATYYIPNDLKKVTIRSAESSSIPYGAFCNCSSIETIDISDSNAQNIYGKAFQGCSALTQLEVPDTVTSIATAVLTGAKSLEFLKLPFVGTSDTATGNQSLFGCIFE